jgi:translation initiation factor IF-3
LVIDENGQNIGEMSNFEALELARSRELDLVEVFPKSRPPVCRIIDYGKFQYQKDKQEKQSKSKQKKVDMKSLRLGIRTDEHDLMVRKNQAEKFLAKGHKVKIEIILRGREKAHQDLARENLRGFLTRIEVPFAIEEDIKRFPGGFNIIITPSNNS